MPTINEQFANAARNMFPANEQYANAMKNMLPNNEQFTTAIRTNLDTQLAMLTALTNNVLGSMEDVVALNLSASNAFLENAAATARQLLSAKDPQEFLSMTVAQVQPTAAKAIAYTRQLASIVAAAQTEFIRVTQEQLSARGLSVSTLVDEVTKNAPAGSASPFAIMQTAIRNASAGYEQFNKNTRQAVEAMEANMNTAHQVSQSAEKTASTTGRNRR